MPLILFKPAAISQVVTVSHDPYYSGTVLLLNMEGANGSTDFADESLVGNTVNPYGAVISTSISKFGTSSMYLDGTATKYVTIPNSSAFSFGAGSASSNSNDFSVELWFNSTTTTNTYGPLIIKQIGAGYGFFIDLGVNGVPRFGVSSSSPVVSTSPSICDGNWHHLVICRVLNAIYFYVDGVQRGKISNANANYDSAQDIYIGMYAGATARKVKGYIDSLRIIKGPHPYTGPFTPPSSQPF